MVLGAVAAKKILPREAKGVNSQVKLLEHNPRPWILEGLEPNANRLKMVDGNGRARRHRLKRVTSYKKRGRRCIVHGQICALSSDGE